MLRRITIFCPVYNEEENVGPFHETFSRVIAPLRSKYEFDFLFADNCSEDSTFEKLSALSEQHGEIGVIRYSRNFGVMKSIYTGILSSTGDAVAVFDCDLQDPPELLLRFISAWEAGAKIAYGKRRSREEPKLITVLRRSFRWLESKFQKNRIEIESGAWFLDRRIVSELRKRNRFEPYLAGLLSRLGFASVGIEYDRRQRELGTSKFNIRSYFSYATDGIVSGTVLPLRLAVWLGVAISTISFLAMIFFLFDKFLFGGNFAAGVAANIIITLFNFGINFIFLGIIGEYVGRIYLERDINEPAIIDSRIEPKPKAGQSAQP
ncbi:glycosyltransferase family 2 protein [Tardiphaga sp. vice278]|uniref:glycosyltransferase family 2 protein n=1 Tax=Tardiphaga sp. vice278 TaxID=2592815 RepID=UPI0011634844|nr:glycosyltransferase family 2 protein [Tardiphaga sp. vice278]QDM17960.1 glycosyltransferase family 2 protein [Tardiphaga sp. vice278]